MDFKHYSVMREQCIDALAIKPDGIYVDMTLGGGGHSSMIAQQLTTGKLIGIDRDSDAIAAASKRLEPWKDNVITVKDNYKNITLLFTIPVFSFFFNSFYEILNNIFNKICFFDKISKIPFETPTFRV